MGYSTSEYIADCEREAERARLIAKHYPDAHREKRHGMDVWAHDDALRNATHFDFGVRNNCLGEPRAVLYPYHLLEEGEIKAAVFAAGQSGHCEGWDFRKFVEAAPEVHAAVMKLLKARR